MLIPPRELYIGIEKKERATDRGILHVSLLYIAALAQIHGASAINCAKGGTRKVIRRAAERYGGRASRKLD